MVAKKLLKYEIYINGLMKNKKLTSETKGDLKPQMLQGQINTIDRTLVGKLSIDWCERKWGIKVSY